MIIYLLLSLFHVLSDFKAAAYLLKLYLTELNVKDYLKIELFHYKIVVLMIFELPILYDNKIIRLSLIFSAILQ